MDVEAAKAAGTEEVVHGVVQLLLRRVPRRSGEAAAGTNTDRRLAAANVREAPTHAVLSRWSISLFDP